MYNFRAVIGVARLSPNYLINKTASFYVEFFRNVPLLLQYFFGILLL